MKKEYGSKNAKMRRQQSLRHNVGKIRFRWILVLSLIVIVALVIFFMWRQGHGTANLKQENQAFSRMVEWFAKHKTNLRSNAKKVKEKMTAAKEEEPEEIHFEFYNALPKAQMSLTDYSSVKTVTTNSENVTLKPIATKSHEKVAVSSNLVNVDQLEKDIAKEFKQINYIVQIASFRNLNAAQQLQQNLINNGLSASIAKLNSIDKPLYRVQLGPYADKHLAQLALKQLQKKGKYGMLRKIDSIN